MIKECNFKSGLTKDRVCFCMLKGIGTCSGEEDCILFQIYIQLHPKKYNVTVNKDEGESYHLFHPKKSKKNTCTRCGCKTHHNYSSGFCDSCYCEVCYEGKE